MIVKLIAKFWNPPIARKSSCAYPSLWRIFSSSEVWIAPGAGAGVSLMPPPSLMTRPAVASEAVGPVAYSPLPVRALSSHATDRARGAP